MNTTSCVRFSCHSRASMGVNIDDTRLADYLLDLHPTCSERPHWSFLSVVIDLMPETGAFRVAQGVHEENPLHFSSLDDAIANAVYRCALILETGVDDWDGLAGVIRSFIVDAHPDLLTPAEEVFHRHYASTKDVALIS